MIIQCMADCFTPLQRWLILRKIFHFSSNLQKKEDELLFLSMFPLDRYCSGCTSGQRIYNSNYGNVSLLLLSSWKVIIAENLIAVFNGVVDTFGHYPGAWHLAFGELNQSERCSEIKSSLSMFYG